MAHTVLIFDYVIIDRIDQLRKYDAEEKTTVKYVSFDLALNLARRQSNFVAKPNANEFH